IWKILQETPGFEPMRLVPVLTKLLAKPETQKMGQKIAEGLAQKAIARLIRNLLIDAQTPQYSLSDNVIQPSLSPAAMQSRRAAIEVGVHDVRPSQESYL
ncbi:MAG: hypothetical protein HC820_07290, partial [Hydrococcus sp. RM1_1_31]|nr:hypothetical protein [Hydrococcus sp. RM1_1_31]